MVDRLDVQNIKNSQGHLVGFSCLVSESGGEEGDEGEVLPFVIHNSLGHFIQFQVGVLKNGSYLSFFEFVKSMLFDLNIPSTTSRITKK